MNPTDFPAANLRLLPPPSMPECLVLAVHRYPPSSSPTEDGGRHVPVPGGYISRWEPTAEERAAIATGGPVWVWVVGDGAPPPIAVTAFDPFEAPAPASATTDAPAGWDDRLAELDCPREYLDALRKSAS